MQCTGCKIVVPYDESYAKDLDCLFCGKRVRCTAEDFLTYPELGVAREVRQTQVQLTNLIDRVTTFGGVSVIEAGTGIGKSFAYLLPSILSGKRTLITTAKKSLQSQLFEKDLPFLQDVLREIGVPFKYAIAYGKSNYVCIQNAFAGNKRDRDAWKHFEKIAESWTWDELEALKKTKDKKKLEVLRFNPELTAEHCVGRTCKYFESGCTYITDRAAVAEANVVVTNHWLFGYHLKLQASLDYHLLGPFTNIVVDEAHKLEDGLRTAFTESISDKKLSNLINAFENGVLTDGREFFKKKELMDAWRALFDAASVKASRQDNTVPALGNAGASVLSFSSIMLSIKNKLSDPSYFEAALGIPATDDVLRKAFVNYFATASKATQPNVSQLSIPYTSSLHGDVGQHLTDDARGKWSVYRLVYEELSSLNELVLRAMGSHVDNNTVTYIDKTPYNNQISIAPIELGAYLKILYKDLNKMSVHYLSATLAVNNAMDIFARRVGLDISDSKVATGNWGSAFDLKKQSTLYISRNVPEPSRDLGQEQYRSKLSDEVFELIEANRGNAFVLFTARDEMLDVASRVAPRTQHPLLVQDGVSASDLLKQYRTTPDSVLFGLKSFWEGVDVAGEKLSLVIITKLPFPGRSDAIVNARRAKAGNAWFSYVDVPDMIFDLRQGVGRLIRTTTDTGLIAILDSRLLTKPYGKAVVRSTGYSQAQTELHKAKAALYDYANNRNAP